MKASFTIKEVRELMRLPFVGFEPIDRSLLPSEPSQLPRTQRRIAELMIKAPSSVPSQSSRTCSLDFFLFPLSFNSSMAKSHSLSSVMFAKTQIEASKMSDPSASAFLTRDSIDLPADLAFRSIGYKSEPLPGMDDLGIHFDARRGVILNDSHGRATQLGSYVNVVSTLPGLYCSGWVKRGPTGVIANTMEDGFATAEAIAHDWRIGMPFLAGGDGWDSLSTIVEQKRIRTVDWDDWRKIDDIERTRGRRKGRERDKFTSVEEMLGVLD